MAEARRNLSYAELQTWRAYRQKYGSLFVGRRLEQEFGRLFARYMNTKLPADKQIEDPRIYMVHEEMPVLTYEEERMKQIEKKKSG
ncbi:hypothetical protein G9F31_00795 [Acinetobacter sp. 187]|nr:hypothetical protein [Acinetobacter lanii]NHC02322.1 hypothetical protein [Acinetobacter lanii]